MIGSVPEMTTFDRSTKPEYVITVPLQFWFCKFNGLALPLLALEYNDVTFKITTNPINQCAYVEQDALPEGTIDDLFANNNLQLQASFLVDYIYLDSPERRKFAQSGHEYLIDQVQYIILQGITTASLPIRIDFENPTKELIWVAQRNSFTVNPDGSTEVKLWNYGVNADGSENPVSFSELFFHGHTRIDRYDGNYFNYVQPYYAHTDTPADGINVYSFAVLPEEQQPTGTCNFSRINDSVLKLTINPKMFSTLSVAPQADSVNVYLFGVSLNVLRILGGMGTLAFV